MWFYELSHDYFFMGIVFKLIHFFYEHQDLATVDSILSRELPPVEDTEAVSDAISSSLSQVHNVLFPFLVNCYNFVNEYRGLHLKD
jgi:hypothetical protein